MDECNIRQKYNEYVENKDDIWNYGNSILYDMCRNEPGHDRADIVVGKIWLIGRSYSAAVERRKTNDGLSGDVFYRKKVSTKMKEICEKLDDNINILNSKNGDIDNNIKKVLETHLLLVNAFDDITKMKKRSFASKYLHFHCPDMFFIYDSRACSTVRKMIKKPEKSLLNNYIRYDKEYVDFLCRVIDLKKIIEEENERITPRQLDDFLLYMAERD